MVVRDITLVANTVQRVLGENKFRSDFTLKNDSATAIFWGTERGVTAAAGIKQGGSVDATGGSYNDRWYKGEVWVISTGTGPLTVIENVCKFQPVMQVPNRCNLRR